MRFLEGRLSFTKDEIHFRQSSHVNEKVMETLLIPYSEIQNFNAK